MVEIDTSRTFVGRAKEQKSFIATSWFFFLSSILSSEFFHSPYGKFPTAILTDLHVELGIMAVSDWSNFWNRKIFIIFCYLDT